MEQRVDLNQLIVEAEAEKKSAAKAAPVTERKVIKEYAAVEVDTSPYEIAHGDYPHGNEVGSWKFGMDFLPIRPNDWNDARVMDCVDRYGAAVARALATAKRMSVRNVYLLP